MSIIGHANKISELNNIIKNQSYSHAYIFCGIDGIGKFLIAKDFAKAILCESSKNGVACGTCAPCTTFGNNSDFIVVEPDDGSIKVDMIRKITEEIMLKPTISERKVIIINDAHLMNDNAQNALLKVLEEPPVYATIILVTSNKEKIISTIKSRCTTFKFDRLSDEEVSKIVGDVDADILALANGSAGKYIKLQNAKYLDILLEMEKIIECKDLLEINRVLTKAKNDKNLKEYIEDILDLLMIKTYKLLGKEPLKISEIISLIEQVRNNILRNANLDLELDYLGIRLWEINNSK